MPAVESQDVQRQLQRALDSPGFAHNERLSGFLRFVVERHMEGRDHELKESVIAIEVFGRRPDYNPKQDAIVRTEAGRLRARLSEYYIGDGSGDTLVIELPKGGYLPVFREVEESREATAPSPWTFGIRPLVVAALVCCLLGLAAVTWWRLQHQIAPVSIAVLPLINLSEDPANDYFADCLTNEIIRNL